MVAGDDSGLRHRASERVSEPGDDAVESVSPARLGPPTYKRAIVIWIALYPAVVVAISLLQPFTADWPTPLHALALTLVVIPAAVWVLIPFVQRLLRHWLEP
jgi:antibiotic biosynthesis monooxygenase (ABM) superfamily enzyme